MGLASYLELDGTLNANGHSITAGGVYLGPHGGPSLLIGRGAITTPLLTVSSRYSPLLTSFNVTAADNITNSFQLYGVNTTLPNGFSVPNLALYSNGATPPAYASATTSTSSNVFNSAYIDQGCIMNLGAPLTLNLSLDLRGTLNANGQAISAPTLYIGYNAGPAVLENIGLVAAAVWKQGNGTSAELLQPGDALGALLLTGASALTVGNGPGQATGLTLSGRPASDLSIAAGSDLLLDLNGPANGWVFRWADPAGGDHIYDLQNFINSGEITFSSLNGGSYSLSSDGFYTYVNVIPVPEPSAMLLTLAAGCVLGMMRRKRR